MLESVTRGSARSGAERLRSCRCSPARVAVHRPEVEWCPLGHDLRLGAQTSPASRLISCSCWSGVPNVERRRAAASWRRCRARGERLDALLARVQVGAEALAEARQGVRLPAARAAGAIAGEGVSARVALPSAAATPAASGRSPRRSSSPGRSGLGGRGSSAPSPPASRGPRLDGQRRFRVAVASSRGRGGRQGRSGASTTGAGAEVLRLRGNGGVEAPPAEPARRRAWRGWGRPATPPASPAARSAAPRGWGR